MRYTKVLAAIAGSALLISPLLASADTIAELQAKIQSLLSQLSAVQTQLQQLQVTATTTTAVQSNATGTAASTLRCPVILRTLTLGARGSDVSDLQAYLGTQGVFQGEATGYFGTQTQAAVQAWQRLQDLVSNGSPSTTGYGVIGPRSINLLMRLCPAPENTGHFSADVNTGNTPLAVNFSVAVPAINGSAIYTIDFGDGTSVTATSLGACAGGGSCRDLRGATHTYTTPGTYTAALYRSASACSTSSICGELVARITITATAPAPACRIVECATGYHLEGTRCSAEQKCVPDIETTTLLCPVYAQCPSGYRADIGMTDSNGCYKPGACLPIVMTTCPVYSQAACPAGYQPGTATTDGNGCTRPGACVPTTSAQRLSAAPSSGTAPLKVTFSGSVNSAGYSVDFGDGASSGAIGCENGGCPVGGKSAVNVSHTYTREGSFVAKLRANAAITAGNCAGVDCNVVGTATITVTGAAICPVYSAPICQPGQYVQYTSKNGCPGYPVCVTDTQAAASDDSQLAAALSALQGALEALKGFFGAQ
jgi:peptidoglycan hydrolase-like protein with peptidoglycan-binding domain